MMKCIFNMALLTIFSLGTFKGAYAETQAHVKTQPQTIVLAGLTPETTQYGRFLNLLYTEAFDRLGVSFTYEYLPERRVAYLSKLGELDGEVSRSLDYGKDNPELLRTRSPIFVVTLSAFSIRSNDIQLSGWDSLKNTSYIVGYSQGADTTHKKLMHALNSEERLASLHSFDQAIKSLVSGRIDLFVVPEMIAHRYMNTPEIQSLMVSSSGVPLLLEKAGVMERIAFYPYLNPKHKALVEPLSKVLSELSETGMTQKFLVESEVAY